MIGNHGKHDVVVLLLEFENNLNLGNLTRQTVINCRSGTQKTQGLERVCRPSAGFLEIMARGFVLEQNLHHGGNSLTRTRAASSA